MAEFCSSVRTLEEATHKTEKENTHFREAVKQIIDGENNQNNIGGNRNSMSSDGGGADRRSMFEDSFLDIPEEEIDLEFTDTYPSTPKNNKNKQNQNQNQQQHQKIQR
jgi:hypothetical protein